jgi:hypothetical protein
MVQYRAADRRARSALLAFCLWAVAALVVVVAEMGRLSILGTISMGDTVSLHDTILNDNLVSAAAWVEIAAFIVTAFAFLAWLKRIAENNRALGVLGRTYASGLALGSLALFILSGVVRYAAALTNQPVNPVGGLIDSSIYEVVSLVLAGVAAVFSVLMIVQLTGGQAARVASLRAALRGQSPPEVALPVSPPANLQLPARPGEA